MIRQAALKHAHLVLSLYHEPQQQLKQLQGPPSLPLGPADPTNSPSEFAVTQDLNSTHLPSSRAYLQVTSTLNHHSNLLPLFASSARKNYSVEALNMLCQYHHKLTHRQAQELIWSRFINSHSAPGRNIPVDLHQDHLNHVCKDSIRGLQFNKVETAIIRIRKALGTISPVQDQFDEQNNVKKPSRAHKVHHADSDRDMIVQHLQKYKIFASNNGRFHSSFPKPYTHMILSLNG